MNATIPASPAPAASIALISIIVPTDVRHFFRHTEIKGQGGFQHLCRGLAERLKDTRELVLHPDELRRIIRYSTTYGDGGFQSRLRRIVTSWVSANIDKLLPH